MPMLTPGTSGDSSQGAKSLSSESNSPDHGGHHRRKIQGRDHELQSGYSFDSKSRNYDFPTPKSGKITLTLSYWSDLKEAKVKIGQ